MSLSQWLVTKLEAPRELPMPLLNKSAQDIQIIKPKGNLEGKTWIFSSKRILFRQGPSPKQYNQCLHKIFKSDPAQLTHAIEGLPKGLLPLLV